MSDRSILLETVEKSPAAVSAQNRDEWLALFSDWGVIEDPVGSQPHLSGLYDRRSGKRGNAPLERFYDTFIDGNTVIFHRDKDFVCGHYVMRDLELEPGGMGVRVPMHLLYELTDEGGVLKVKRLAAHWDVIATIKQAIADRKSNQNSDISEPQTSSISASPSSGLGSKMLKFQGLPGILRWMKCLFSVGEKGKSKVAQFIESVNKKEASSLRSLLMTSQNNIRYPVDRDGECVEDFIARNLTMSASKYISAGSSVSCSLVIADAGVELFGVGVFEINRRNFKIESASFFFDESNYL